MNPKLAQSVKEQKVIEAWRRTLHFNIHLKIRKLEKRRSLKHHRFQHSSIPHLKARAQLEMKKKSNHNFKINLHRSFLFHGFLCTRNKRYICHCDNNFRSESLKENIEIEEKLASKPDVSFRFAELLDVTKSAEGRDSMKAMIIASQFQCQISLRPNLKRLLDIGNLSFYIVKIEGENEIEP